MSVNEQTRFPDFIWGETDKEGNKTMRSAMQTIRHDKNSYWGSRDCSRAKEGHDCQEDDIYSKT